MSETPTSPAKSYPVPGRGPLPVPSRPGNGSSAAGPPGAAGTHFRFRTDDSLFSAPKSEGDTVPQRILLLGGPTSGKSTSWISIAEFCEKTGKDNQFWCIDTDNALRVQCAGMKNVQIHVPQDWPEYAIGINTAKKHLRPKDFLIVDMISEAWVDVQEWYVREVLGTTMDVLKYENKKSGGKGNPLLNHYAEIGLLYLGWEKTFLPRANFNVICTAPVSMLNDGSDKGRHGRDDQSIINLFLPDGFKASGHKLLAHRFNTIIMVQQATRHKFAFTVVRERDKDLVARNETRREEVSSFCAQYMMKRAGWRP